MPKRKMAIALNARLLNQRVPNITSAARSVGLRPATVSSLCTGKTDVSRAEVGTLLALADLAGCTLDDLLIREPVKPPTLADLVTRWARSGTGRRRVSGPEDAEPIADNDGIAALRALAPTPEEVDVRPRRRRGRL